jgi:poly-beta-1,6-N-acetyl-D-glucosamine biosynthesis protein PgaD
MSCSLIIDARHRLRWYQRLFSDASAALLWSGWLWLWVPLLKAYASLADLGVSITPALSKVSVLGSEEALPYSVVALVGASGTLFAWNRLPVQCARAVPALSLREEARHFQLTEHELRAGREAAVCVVHHDEHGRIVRLEPHDQIARLEPGEPPRQVERRSA